MVLWPNFGHCTTTINVWERMGEKYLAQLIGEGACQPDIFTKHRLGCELSCGINVREKIGEKHLAQLVGVGRVNVIFLPN